MPCSKNFYVSAFKNLYFINFATCNYFWKMWYTWSESQSNSAPASKNLLWIWIRNGRTRRSNVLKLSDSHHWVIFHTNILTSNLSSDTTEVLNYTSSFGLVNRYQTAVRSILNNLQPSQWQSGKWHSVGSSSH